MRFRKKYRLLNFDYSLSNAYFVTFCTYDKKKILSKIIQSKDLVDPDILLSELGRNCIELIEKYNKDKIISIPHYTIMPNHIHLIVDMTINPQNNIKLSNIVRGIKSWSKRKLSNSFFEIHGPEIWQKSFYDRIIRDEKEYYKFVKYIEENPLKWELDEYWV